mgnify:CR=1 FL=1
MKRNITINMQGRLYAIDEDAYELLKNYTDTLRRYFVRSEGGTETADDIEARIAELMDDLKSQGVEAITIEHVQDIIQRIGKLEDIAGSSEEEKSEQGGNSETNDGHWGKEEFTTRTNNYFDGLRGRRFYRDEDNKKLAGVLAGCSNFFGGDVLVWRIGFVLLFLLLGSLSGTAINWFINISSGWLILLYIAVWILAPVASTPEERLKMVGKDVNAQNLADEVAQEAKRKTQEQSNGNGDGHDSGSIGRGCLSIIGTMVNILLIVMGLICWLPFFGLLIATAVFIAAPEILLDEMFNMGAINIYQEHGLMVWLAIGCLLALFFIPGYCAAHALIARNRMGGWQRACWFTTWVVALLLCIGSFVRLGFYADQRFSDDDDDFETSWSSDSAYAENDSLYVPDDSLTVVADSIVE